MSDSPDASPSGSRPYSSEQRVTERDTRSIQVPERARSPGAAPGYATDVGSLRGLDRHEGAGRSRPNVLGRQTARASRKPVRGGAGEERFEFYAVRTNEPNVRFRIERICEGNVAANAKRCRKRVGLLTV
jgi:hypothetical protein